MGHEGSFPAASDGRESQKAVEMFPSDLIIRRSAEPPEHRRLCHNSSPPCSLLFPRQSVTGCFHPGFAQQTLEKLTKFKFKSDVLPLTAFERRSAASHLFFFLKK